MKNLPKYIEKALKDRTKYVRKAMVAGNILDKYATDILHMEGEAFDEACLCSDFRIFCEAGCAEDTTRQALLKGLKRKDTVKERGE